VKQAERETQSARRRGRYLHNTQQTNIYVELKIPALQLPLDLRGHRAVEFQLDFLQYLTQIQNFKNTVFNLLGYLPCQTV
jgi:hypothetical protein